MTRLRDAFDVLIDRGEPVGAETVWSRALAEVAEGPVVELQAATILRGVRFRVVAVVAMCVAVALATALALNGHSSTVRTTSNVPSTISCNVSVGIHRGKIALSLGHDGHAQVALAGYTFRFAIVVPDAHQRGSISGIVTGPGLGTGVSVKGGFPIVPGIDFSSQSAITGHNVDAAAFTCGRSRRVPLP